LIWKTLLHFIVLLLWTTFQLAPRWLCCSLPPHSKNLLLTACMSRGKNLDLLLTFCACSWSSIQHSALATWQIVLSLCRHLKTELIQYAAFIWVWLATTLEKPPIHSQHVTWWKLGLATRKAPWEQHIVHFT
jgi:hypothetical protein